MQLQLLFSAPKMVLPISYRQLIHGLIYHALAADVQFSEYLHNRGYIGDGRVFKHFTFGQLEGRYHVREGCIVFKKKASLEIRSIDERVIFLLAKQLFVGRKIRLGNCDVEIVESDVKDEHLLVDQAEVYMCSPAAAHKTLPDGHTVFFSPCESAYYDALIRNAKRKWISLKGKEERFDFSIKPAENTVYKKQVSMFKDTCISAWEGNFILTGLPEVLDMLYQSGLGEKNPQGFGMFNVVHK